MSLSSVSRLPRLRSRLALQIKKWMAGVLAQGAHSCGCGGHNIAVAGQRTGQTVLKIPKKQKVQMRVRVGLMQH